MVLSSTENLAYNTKRLIVVSPCSRTVRTLQFGVLTPPAVAVRFTKASINGGFAMRRPFMHSCRTGALAIATTALVPVWGQSQAGWADAVNLLERGQDSAALAALDRWETQHAGELDYDMLLGRAAFESGHHARAILAFERAHFTHPNNEAAKTALIQALLAVGDSASAQVLLKDTLPPFPDPLQSWSQSQFFSTFDPPRYHGMTSIKGHVALGMGRDSNANAGPRDASLSGDLPNNAGTWRLSSGSSVSPASHWVATASVSGRWTWSPQWSLTGQLATDHRGYAGAAQRFDTGLAEASGGINFVQDRHEWGLLGQLGQTRLNQHAVRNVSGLNSNWIYRIDGFRQWATFLQSLAVSYPFQSHQDTRRNVLGSTYMHVWPTGASAFVGLYVGKETASSGKEYFGHDLNAIRTGVQWPLSPQWSVFYSLTHEHRRHGADDPFFGRRRIDQQTDTALGLTWVPARGWRVTPHVLFTRNSSTLAINDYRRRQTSFVVRREF